ncbi:hypothetical protein TELCIR_05887 [Teladorsagia circumcincta]|uniref:Craniofacial development protein 2 n=1 Tax=Teladorsagia circumcincta TaxID=45464 RepID=A0A2G9UPW9_TELCI|nr:hypothetical protein TELCIR_05887 [Teladorsagia circumcincta]
MPNKTKTRSTELYKVMNSDKHRGESDEDISHKISSARLFFLFVSQSKAMLTPPLPVPSPDEKGGETTDLYDIAELGRLGSSLVTDAPILSSVFSPKNKTYIGTWTVRTLIRTGNLAQLLREFKRYRLDMLGISEIRWIGNGRMSSDDKTILYSGHSEKHEGGVGIVLNKKATNALDGWKPVNERIITARFVTEYTRITVVQVYAPTEVADDEIKNEIYEKLQETIDALPRRDF